MRQSKLCNCRISSNQNIRKEGVNHSFCEKCGSILIKDSEGNIYELPIDSRKQRRYQYAYNLHIGDEVKVSGYFIPQAENCYLIKYPRISGRSMY